MTNDKGFTLIELLIVIGVIAVLAAILIALLNPTSQMKKAKNAQRYIDLHQVGNALEVYYIDHLCYPASLDKLAENQVYLKWVPKDPETGSDYPYEATGDCPQWVVLYGNFYRYMVRDEICPLPLSTIPDCKPVNYDRGDDYIWGCSILGNVDCSDIKNYVLPQSFGPTPTQTPTPTNSPTPTNNPTVNPTPTVIPTCTQANASYACTGGPPPLCNYVGVGNPMATYCTSSCDGVCPGN